TRPPPGWPSGIPNSSHGAGQGSRPALQVRTVISTDRGDGSRKPKTIITINRCRNPERPSPSLAPFDQPKQPQQIPTRLGPSPLASDRLMLEPPNGMFQDDLEQCEKLRQSRGFTKDLPKPVLVDVVDFGFPTSPSSTLRNDTKISMGASSPSFSFDRSDGQLSMSSIETSITVVDDGLSPWGLPKTLHSCEEDRYETAADFLSNPKSDFEAELANIDADFKFVRESLAERSSLQTESSKELQLRKLQSIIYAAKLVVSKRASDQRNKQLQRKNALVASSKSSSNASTSSMGFLSAFTSWI
ncbi:hypothetical protein EGM85_11415, partial [Macrococcus caseolyticus]